MSKKMDKDTNALNWFEIAAVDILRAKKFYETIFEITMFPMDMPEMKMVVFPPTGEKGNVGGALVQSNMHHPSSTGTLVYLNANPDLQLVLNRVEKAGGKVTMPKTLIGKDFGSMALVEDTEGNVVGIHSGT